MNGCERADQSERSDTDNTGDKTPGREHSDDQGGDSESREDSDAKRQLVVGSEPSDGQFLEPWGHSIDELATDRINWGDNIDDACGEHSNGHRDSAGDQAGHRAVTSRR
jgi:hypothetical protein